MTPLTWQTPETQKTCARHRLVVDRIRRQMVDGKRNEITSYYCATPRCDHAGTVVAHRRRKMDA